MKTIRTISGIALVLGLLLTIGVMSVSAAGPANPDPLTAPFIDNQAHNINANSFEWYRFDYSGTDATAHPAVTIRLVNGNNSNVNFEIWSSANLNDWWDKQPVGKGTALNVACDSGVVNGSGGCQTNDLVWSGAFGATGPYYVRIVNNNSTPVMAMLTIQGDGVSLIPHTVSNLPAQAPSIGPKNPNMDDPARSTLINGQPISIPANSVMWFRFDYNGNGDTPHTPVTIRLVNGNGSGVSFDVYSPEQMSDWWDNTPVGKGTLQSVNCDTGLISGNGGCKTSDLSWKGAFGSAGTYYVRVKNDNSSPVMALLTIQ